MEHKTFRQERSQHFKILTNLESMSYDQITCKDLTEA